MSKALADLGYVAGKEREPKPLFWAWVNSDYSKTIKFCEKAEAFQDSPFSFPNT
ncbi:hypothetical protein [Salinivibrio kushneri]|nr:hypothetical protein [Salinivibrio kushneri]